MIRTEVRCSVSRFAGLVGVPRRTYCWRLARLRGGDAGKGPWPAPVVDRIEPAVAKLAAQFAAWGHRKIWAMGRYDGWDLASPSIVHRAMARRGLLQPVRYQANAASSPPPAGKCSWIRQRDATGCGRWTSPPSRPPAREPGSSAASSTTPPRSLWRAP